MEQAAYFDKLPETHIYIVPPEPEIVSEWGDDVLVYQWEITYKNEAKRLTMFTCNGMLHIWGYSPGWHGMFDEEVGVEVRLQRGIPQHETITKIVNHVEHYPLYTVYADEEVTMEKTDLWLWQGRICSTPAHWVSLARNGITLCKNEEQRDCLWQAKPVGEE